MGQWFSTTCPIWLNLNKSQPINDDNEPDERTPLIVNPPPPRPSPQLVQDTAQQIADEAAANKIVDETVRCLVHVYSQAPFSHLSIDSQTQDTSHTPDGSTTTWRAYDPPSCPPISPEIRRLRLGYDQPPLSTESNQRTRIDQKRSYHSLKTMVNHANANRSETTPSDTTTPTRSDSTPDQSSNLSSSSQDLQSHSQHLRDPTDTSDHQCDTMTSFQTALEHTPSHAPSESQPSNSQPPEFVGKLWPNFHTSLPLQDPSALERNEFLTDDPQDLRALLESGFTLKDSGPILVDL